MKKIMVVLSLMITLILVGCTTSETILTDEDVKLELEKTTTFQMNKMGKPKILGIHNGLILIEKHSCSDICPDYGRVEIVYQNVTKEECANIGGEDKVDGGWGGYIGCTPKIN